MSTPRRIRLGSRGSALAIWQTEHVAARLHALYPDLTIETVVIQTKGDLVVDRPLPSIGGKGLFTLELEERLRQGGIDAAVHSLKDLPVADPPGLTLGAIPARGDVADALIVRGGEEASKETGRPARSNPGKSDVSTRSSRSAGRRRSRHGQPAPSRPTIGAAPGLAHPRHSRQRGHSNPQDA